MIRGKKKHRNYHSEHETIQSYSHGPNIQGLKDKKHKRKKLIIKIIIKLFFCLFDPSQFSFIVNITCWADLVGLPVPKNGHQGAMLARFTLPEKFFLVSESASGARKAGVPTVLVRRASAPSNWLLTPKSAIFTCPSSATKRLDGLMSR